MRPPPPPPPPKSSASNKLMTIPEDWDKSGAVPSNTSIGSASEGGVCIASTGSSFSNAVANSALNKRDSEESDDSGSESDDSTSNGTSDSDECSGSSSSTCSSTDSDCSCSGSSCDQSRPSLTTRHGSSRKGGSVSGAGSVKERVAAAATASSPSYAIAATKSRVLPKATTTVAATAPSPIPRPLPLENIKSEHRSAMTMSGALSNMSQESLVGPSASPVLEMASMAAAVPSKRKSAVSAIERTNATGNHQMVPKEVPILPPPPIALLQTIPATSIVFKSEPIYISQAESCVGSENINSLVHGAIIQSTRCSSAGGRIAPKFPIPKDNAAIFSKPILPLMPPPPSTKVTSLGAIGINGGVKRTEFRLRPESDILKQSVVRAAATAAAISGTGRGSSTSVAGPRLKTSGSKKKKSSSTEKVRYVKTAGPSVPEEIYPILTYENLTNILIMVINCVLVLFLIANRLFPNLMI